MVSFTQNVFSEERQPGDLDLVQEITKMMEEGGHPAPYNWQANAIIEQALLAAPKLQRFLINRFWRTRLGNCAQSTMTERFCLIEDGSIDEYLQVFRTGVLPTVIEMAL